MWLSQVAQPAGVDVARPGVLEVTLNRSKHTTNHTL
ncbi:hypothetical protein BVRB_6g139920 [Beta vulgaris subsp. vulgaris]|nr:hypothetical protein BVRB_6g139920 [Beta vulgaris subsp. vulgaris]